MSCLKCGRETQPEQVFCAGCLADMAKHPVRPDTPVLIPRRNGDAVRHAPKRKAPPKPEEQMAKMRKTIRNLWLTLTVFVLAAALGIAGMILWFHRSEKPPVGQNYSTVQSTTLPSEGTAP